MPRIRLVRVAALLAVAVACLAGGRLLPAARAQAPSSAFTATQRAEIVGIVRDAMKRDPSILRDAVAALQADEARARDASARQAIGGAGAALAATPGDPVAGNPRGDVTLVEFYDVRCPYCRAMLGTDASLIASDPRLRVVYKDIPILGAPSLLGARAVLAAANQGGYLRMRDAVMRGPQQITEETLQASAASAGLDWARLRRDMDGAQVQARIDANLRLAHQIGVDGTPAYVVGTRMLPGALSLDDLKAAVAQARG